MARTPSKITKRDIDKDLYLEIVSEASNETNIQKLLDNYIRKDEGIAEWQLPTQYKTNLSKKLNDIDADVQTMKSDTTQKKWNEDVLRRLQVVEKKEGVVVDDDSNVSPIVGTQVAANTANISKNTRQIAIVSGKLTELENRHRDDKLQAENDRMKIREETDEKMSTTSSRMDSLELALDKKRNKTDLITEADLDDNIKKNLHAVLNIGDKTLSTLDNMDAFVERVNKFDERIQANEDKVQQCVNKNLDDMSKVEQAVEDKTKVLSDTEAQDVQMLQSMLELYRTNSTTSVTNLQDQVNSLRDTNTRQLQKISDVNDKVENVARSAENNTINIAGNTNSIEDLKMQMESQDKKLESSIDDIHSHLNEAAKYPGVAMGRLLSVLDEAGNVVGKDIVKCLYIANDSDHLKTLMHEGVSPIYSKQNDKAYERKVEEEVKKNAEDAAKAAESSSTDKTEAAGGTPSETPAPSGDTAPAGTTSSESGTTASEATGSESGASGETKPSDPTSPDSGSTLSDEDAKKYNEIPGYMGMPENYDILVYDMETEKLAGFTDSIGQYREFCARPAAEKVYAVEVAPGEAASIVRDSGSRRIAATAMIFDDAESSPTFGKWLNSEGVITVAYSDNTYTLYNNSSKKQQVRLYTE